MTAPAHIDYGRSNVLPVALPAKLLGLFAPRRGDPGALRAALIAALQAATDPTTQECIGALIDWDDANTAHNVDYGDVELARESAGRLRDASEAMDATANRMEDMLDER